MASFHHADCYLNPVCPSDDVVSEERHMDFSHEVTYRATRLPVTLATTLIPDAYRSPEYHQGEVEQLWARSWVGVGFSSEVEEPGRVIVRKVAGRSVIVSCDHDGRRHAFLNVCRHRGAQLVLEDCVVGKRIRCPYHAWAYDLDGRCLGTPLFEGSDIPADYEGMFDMAEVVAFDKADHGLFQVRLDEWEGMLFVNLDGGAPGLGEWLGDLSERIGGYGLGGWKVRATSEYDIAANWKLVAENFMEYYHLPWVHPELVKVSRMEDHHRFQGPGMYTGMTTTPISQDSSTSGWLELPPSPSVVPPDSISGRFILIFPNVALSVLPNHAFVMMLEPAAVDRTLERTTLLTSEESIIGPESRQGLTRLGDFWDHVNREDIEIVERVQRGISTPEYPGGRMCYRFEEPLHRFQNMVIDRMVGIDRIPTGDPI